MDTLIAVGIIIAIILIVGTLFEWIPKICVFFKYSNKLEQIAPQIAKFDIDFHQRVYGKAINDFRQLSKDLEIQFKIKEKRNLTVEDYIMYSLNERIHREKRQKTTKKYPKKQIIKKR
jgi:hypothetical protein